MGCSSFFSLSAANEKESKREKRRTEMIRFTGLILRRAELNSADHLTTVELNLVVEIFHQVLDGGIHRFRGMIYAFEMSNTLAQLAHFIGD